jgi:hypothetical protein
MRAAPLTNRLLALALALALLPVAAGCSYGAVIVTDDGRAFPPTPAREVRLHPGRDPGYPMHVIGPVAVFTFGEAPDAMRELAAQAAGVGADAVVEVRLTKLSKNTGASGVAVKRAMPAPPPTPARPPAEAPPLAPPPAAP